MDNTSNTWRLGAWLAALHTALFFPFFVLIGPPDGESLALFTLFFYLDYPVRDLYAAPSFLSPLWTIPVVGGLYWFYLGGVIQALGLLRRAGGGERVAVRVLLLGCLCLLPGLAWRSLQEWERRWHRGYTAGEDFRHEEAIPYLEWAIRWSPPENPRLGGMWEYLGRMRERAEEFPAAEAAYTRRLEWETSRPAPSPAAVIGAWTDLASCAKLRGDSARRRECLHNAIAHSRAAYGEGADPEAGCLAVLARAAHEEGNAAEARELMERAIRIWDTLSNPYGADWGRGTLEQWSAEQGRGREHRAP